MTFAVLNIWYYGGFSIFFIRTVVDYFTKAACRWSKITVAKAES